MEETTKQLLTTIAENQPKIKELGYNEGFSAGKKSEYDEFWDVYQKNGNRDNYGNAFTGTGWNEKTFKPKYDMKNFVSASRMFCDFAYHFSSQNDIVELLKKADVTIDFSSITNAEYMCYNAGITHFPKCDFRNVTIQFTRTFGTKYLKTIDELILSDTGTQIFNYTFGDGLVNIKIGGVIGRNISFSTSPLSVESMKSIITHLKDYSGTESEKTYTVTFKTSAFEALEAEGNTSPNGNTWTEYIDDLKWNLALA